MTLEPCHRSCARSIGSTRLEDQESSNQEAGGAPGRDGDQKTEGRAALGTDPRARDGDEKTAHERGGEQGTWSWTERD